MGFYSLKNILYSLRKISKYLCYSLLITAFIIVCLLLSGSRVLATVTDFAITVPGSDFVGKFSSTATYTVASDGTLSVSGSIENHNIGITYPVKFDEYEDAYIVPFASQNYSSTSYFFAVVPKTANFWGYTSWGYNANYTNQNLNVNLVSDVPFSVYRKSPNNNFFDQISSSVTSFSENHTCCIPLCDFYTDSNKTLQIFDFSFEPTFDEPYIAMPNDSTSDYISGSFSDFMVVSNSDIDYVTFHFEEDVDTVPNYNIFGAYLDENSPYYLSNYTPSDGGKVFIIPKNVIPNGYSTGVSYKVWLGYSYNNSVYITEPITWTTNFSQDSIVNDNNQQQTNINNGLNDINSFLNNTEVSNNDIEIPTIVISSDLETFGNSLFLALQTYFTSDVYNDVIFSVPFTNSSITIPSDLVESRLPSVIVGIIHTFYWYLFCRYIIVDILRMIDKMRQGIFLTAPEGNIKTEVL